MTPGERMSANRECFGKTADWQRADACCPACPLPAPPALHELIFSPFKSRQP